MLIADAVHEHKIMDNVTQMEDRCEGWLGELDGTLDLLLARKFDADAPTSPDRPSSFDASKFPVRSHIRPKNLDEDEPEPEPEPKQKQKQEPEQ
eukprot:716419-Rhodomonas_salina.2